MCQLSTEREALNSTTRSYWLVLVIVWAISVAYMAMHLNRGWIPSDEGTLGQSAQRVLNGDLPQRDFDDYTGGLTFVNALAFHELGVSLASMRIVLFVFFVTWVPAVFYISSRFGSPYSTGAITLLAVAWSVPNYPAAMPSWYNLFFATFGAAALIRYLDRGSRRWLYVAGICGSLSILVKITGVYYITGVLLFFVFREQVSTNEENRDSSTHAHFYSTTVAVTLSAFLVLLFKMIHEIPSIRGFIFFVAPEFGLVALLLAREFSGIAGSERERFTALLRMCIPFGVGIAIPIMLFLFPYVLSGSVHDLMHGLVSASSRAIHFTAFGPEDPRTMIEIFPFVLPVILAYKSRRLGRAISGIILALFASIVLILSTRSKVVYSLGWRSLATSIPALVMAGIAILWYSCAKKKMSVVRQQQIMLIMCVATLCSLVQFPLSVPIYFCYDAPLVILFAVAVFASVGRPPRFALGVLTVFYLLFAVLRMTPSFLNYMGWQYAADSQTQQLTIARAGGLRVEPSDADLYDKLIPLVQSHAASKFIYAAPDCPEVYFLSGLRTPSRHFFEFAEDPVRHTEVVLNQIDSLHINLVAINLDPKSAHPMDAELRSDLEKRFPHGTDVGHFEVRWKE